ncbi:hypothetical protein CRG98_044002 [Punica granatum]|uniref:Disease resistance R13L4/SHOC-2-like LRR domain-containing protein n=1 Tax=Punica granatum TaxID=22663 RepID=A0A2I0HV25_PUNGR|nr:hypothetical protein CRG98_044002 [Punica granatum]
MKSLAPLSIPGIECNEESGRVVALDLGRSCLYGTINSSSNLFRLDHLRRLNLADNDFDGSQIPSNLGSLSDAQVHGIFSDRLFQLPNMQHIDLAYNSDLNGHLPKFISTSSLQMLRLRFTNFSRELPASLGNLQSLLSLDLSSAHFEGSLPQSIGNLHSLNYLNIEICSFSGSIPSSFSNLTELTYLNVDSNQFSAAKLESLSWLWKLAKVKRLNLKSVNLLGEIPSSSEICPDLCPWNWMAMG